MNSQTPLEADVVREQLKALLKAHPTMNQSKVAAAAGLNRSQISRLLDDGSLTDESLRKLSEAIPTLEALNNDPLPPDLAGELARWLRDDKLVLVVGAGLSHLCEPRNPGADKLPLWREFAERVAEKFSGEGLRVEDFSDVTDLFDYAKSLSDERLYRAVKEVLDDSRYKPSPAHAELARLPWAEIWTTNYDNLLARSTGYEPIEPLMEFDRISECNRQKRGYVLHLHGTLDNPHTLTKDDYRGWNETHPKLLAHIRHSLVSRRVLFVGYGLGDPNIDAALTWLRAANGEFGNAQKSPQREHYAWMWQLPEARRMLMQQRDHIRAISFVDPAQYARAFAQLHREWQALPIESKAAASGGNVANDLADRARWAERARAYAWNHSGVGRDLYIPGPGYRDSQIGIDDIFVEPSLAPRAPATRWDDGNDVWDDDATQWDVSDEKETHDKNGEADERSHRHLREREAAREKSLEENRKRPALQLIARERFSVILGEPGAGKSLLLRAYARKAVESWRDRSAVDAKLPFFFSLNQWDERRKSTGLDPAPMLLKCLREFVASTSDVMAETVSDWIADGVGVHWLLDGLDEIRDEASRDSLRAAVETLASQRPNDCFTVTARPAGYRVSFGGTWQEHELLPMDDTQVRATLEKWHVILRENDGMLIPVSQLDTDLKGNLGLASLRRNPLLLCLAVMFYRTARRLPKDRFEYYQNADENIRIARARDRILRDANGVRESDAADWRAVLGRIALDAMQTNRVRIARSTIEEIVGRYYLEVKRYSYRETSEEVARFLRAADDLLGVIVAVSPEEYGFLHLTFLEYHAACELLAMPRDALNTFIARFWDHPDWLEVWELFLLGAKALRKEDRAIALIEGTLANPSELDEAELHRHRIQALKWAGLIGGGLFDLDAWKRLEDWTIQHFADRAYRFIHWPDFFSGWQVALPAPLRDDLVRGLREDKDLWVRARCALSLASQAGEALVRDALLRGLREDEDSDVRRRCAQSLASQAGEALVRDALLRGLREDERSAVRRRCAQSLASQAGEALVRDALLRGLREDEDSDVRRRCADSLASQAGEVLVREALLRGLREDEHSWVRRLCADSLASQAGEAPVRDALLRVLREDQHPEVRGLCADSLASQAGEAPVREALLRGLREDEDSAVRRQCTQSLASQAGEAPVREALLRGLREDEHSWVRGRCAQSLASQAGEVLVRDALLCGLREDEDSDVRRRCAQSLASQVGEVPVRDALLRGLREDEDSDVRRRCAQSLASQVGEVLVREALLSGLREHEDSWVRSRCAKWLASQAREVAVRDALLRGLREDNESGVRRQCAESLASQMGEVLVRDALLRGLREDNESGVRRQCAESLASQVGEALVRDALLRGLRKDKNGHVRKAAFDGLNAAESAHRAARFG